MTQLTRRAVLRCGLLLPVTAVGVRLAAAE